MNDVIRDSGPLPYSTYNTISCPVNGPTPPDPTLHSTLISPVHLLHTTDRSSIWACPIVNLYTREAVEFKMGRVSQKYKEKFAKFG